jgi:flavin-binding protein dodecin
VQSVWIKEQQANVENNQIVSYQVNMLVTFVLE